MGFSQAQESELGHSEYWDERYKSSTTTGDEPSHEWFKDFKSLKPFLAIHVFDPTGPEVNPRVIHLGCGDSALPLELFSLGYRNQLCIDFSSIVIERMSHRHADKDGIEWQIGDVRDMASVPDKTIDIAIDKGTLDAMLYGSLWDPPDEVLENTKRYIDEVVRILRPGGIFLYVTFRQPHFMRKFLARDGVWDMSVETLQDDPGAFEYFGWILRKSATIPEEHLEEMQD